MATRELLVQKSLFTGSLKVNLYVPQPNWLPDTLNSERKFCYYRLALQELNTFAGFSLFYLEMSSGTVDGCSPDRNRST